MDDGKQGAKTWDRLNKNDHRRPKRCGGILFGRCFRAPTPLRLLQIIYHPLSLLLNVVAVYTTVNGLSLRKYVVEFRDNNGQEGPPRNGCCFKLLRLSCLLLVGPVSRLLAPSSQSLNGRRPGHKGAVLRNGLSLRHEI